MAESNNSKVVQWVIAVLKMLPPTAPVALKVEQSLADGTFKPNEVDDVIVATCDMVDGFLAEESESDAYVDFTRDLAQAAGRLMDRLEAKGIPAPAPVPA